MAKNPRGPRTGAAPDAAQPAADTPLAFQLPPQGAGAPRRPFSTGSPAAIDKLNVAARTLIDPVARMSASRPYSGQARSWRR
jgi:hypothetical protein